VQALGLLLEVSWLTSGEAKTREGGSKAHGTAVAHPSARGTALGVVDALEKETLVNNALDDDMGDVNVLEYVAVDEPEVKIVGVELKAVEPDVELALFSVLLGVG
jgi:hypothetical protein